MPWNSAIHLESHIWLSYMDLFTLSERDSKLKPEKNCKGKVIFLNGLPIAELTERRKNLLLPMAKLMDLCTNNEHVIAKMHKLLLKMNMEDEMLKIV